MIDIFYIEDDENIEALMRKCPALALIDWNMPDGTGSGLCRWIRENRKELPVMVLTVRGDSRDIVSGFESGADDYVVKPFELEVLLSRIRALLRRTGDVSGRYLSCGGISLDTEKMRVCRGGALSPSEYQVLLFLMQNRGRTVTRKNLLEAVWDSNGNFVNDNTLTVTMKRLREKLHQPDCLKTVRSVGYRMEDTAG